MLCTDDKTNNNDDEVDDNNENADNHKDDDNAAASTAADNGAADEINENIDFDNITLTVVSCGTVSTVSKAFSIGTGSKSSGGTRFRDSCAFHTVGSGWTVNLAWRAACSIAVETLAAIAWGWQINCIINMIISSK